MKYKHILVMSFFAMFCFILIFLGCKETNTNEELLEEAIEFYEQKDYLSANDKLNELTISTTESEKWKERVTEKILKEYAQYKLIYGDLE